MSVKTYPENKKLVPHKTPLTWIVVANGRHAQIYMHDHNNPMEMLTPVLDRALEAEALDIEMGRHALPRVHESMGATRHMIEPRLDIKAETRLRFMVALAQKLDAAKKSGEYEQLILIAPAKVTGDLRDVLSDDVHKTVIAEINKDLVRVPLEALSLYLKDRFRM